MGLRLPLLLCLLLPFTLFAQDLKKLKQRSYQTFVYRIPADSTEKYLLKDSIPVDVYAARTPDYIFQGQYVNVDSLPRGHYLVLWIDDIHISAGIEVSTNLVAYPLNNEKFIQLAVRNKTGNTVLAPEAWINKKKLQYLPSAGTFKIKYKPAEDDLVKVCTATDTIFLNLDIDRENEPVARQKWRIFKGTRLGKWLTFIPRTVGTLFRKKYRYNRYAAGKGFVVFNQPKYKTGDTVKLKAYVLNNKNKRYRKPVDLYLEYYLRGKSHSQQLAHLNTTATGTYLYEFILRDTLSNDLKYSIIIKNKKNKQLVQGSFKIEDYVLDEVASYSINTPKEHYYENDSLIFILNAKDANGLNLLDAKARLVLLTTAIKSWNKDSVIVADTLYNEERKLNTQGDTRFAIATTAFPNADLQLTAKAIFRNSNNEVQEEKADVMYGQGKKQLLVKQVADSLLAEYMVNGKSTTATGTVEITGDKLELEKKITYPAKLKIDPLADNYWFDVDGDSAAYKDFNIGSSYQLTLSQFNNKDTLGFLLYNPYKIPVFFTVFNGDRVLATAKDDAAVIQWKMVAHDPRKAYRVQWQYYWAGEEVRGDGSIGHLYKQLNISVNAQAAVFPGQKDTVTIEVKDHKHRPAANVNLTAFSYNSQFKKDINIPNLPYLANYKLRPGIRRDTYESDDAYLLKKYPLGYHQQFRSAFGVDTMLYYQMLFPKDGFKDVAYYIKDYYPQLSVHVVHKGIPQQVYLLYLNRNLVYYSGVTDKKHYAFSTVGGYAQIAFRLADRQVEIDSIYIQPNYKHDLVFDLDQLPAKAKITHLSNELTIAERQLLENSLWQFKDASYISGGAYVWQFGEALKLNSGYNHIAGPFTKYDSLHFFAPGRFDVHFLFEPGYQYQLSSKVLRLEKMKVFPDAGKPVKLNAAPGFRWQLGDTVLTPPEVSYKTPEITKYLRLSPEFNYRYKSLRAGTAAGALKFTVPKDSLLLYIVLHSSDTSASPIVLSGTMRHIYNLDAGTYSLLLVNRNFKATQYAVLIKEDETTCLHITSLPFVTNTVIDQLVEASIKPVVSQTNPVSVYDSSVYISADKVAGNMIISGKVTDAKGKMPIPGVTVAIKGTTLRTITDEDGSFSFLVREGRYTLVFATVGYMIKEVKAEAKTGNTSMVVTMEMSNESLNEVVVMGYSSQRRSMYSGAASKVSAATFDQALQGRVAGLNITSGLGAPGVSSSVIIRGAISGASTPLFVIDGIPYEAMPKNIRPEEMETIDVLSDASATALYGSRGAGGVVIISTKTKALRSQFRDYATWQPLLFTGEDGKARFEIIYPDNVTSWQTYVIGIDKKNRAGIGATLTQSYKPVMAQLSLPQFAIEGDRINVIGKTLNYTKDRFNVTGSFSLKGSPLSQWSFDLPANESVINQQLIVATFDTLKLQYNITTTTGFKDGEERKLPVLPKGTEESTGEFYLLQQDTTVQFNAQQDAAVELHIQNNTLDVLLGEIEYLKQYPYYCMEQIASKIKGYAMEKQVRKALNQEFKHQRDMQRLIEKLQKAQLYDGSWSWWEKGTPNLYITNYIVQALLPLREDPLIEVNIRNGLLYLQNNLYRLTTAQLLSSLSTMAMAGHVLDYQPHLAKLQFDSLSLHQQWMYVQIKQSLKMDHAKELQYLLSKGINTMLGGTFWGEETWLWYNNDKATTVLAFTVLQKEPAYQHLLPSIIRYFLEAKKGGYWRNTVESASITAAILPQVLQQNKNFMQPATINITGDTSFTVQSFPFSTSFSSNVKHLQVSKQGGGSTYLTLFQSWWNKTPVPVTDKFIMATQFAHNGNTITSLRAGERVKLKVQVQALQQAEYVMIEVPVPAGCIIVNKQADGYTEYMKNKVLIFREMLAKGSHSFTIDLECRYAGTYTVNPAKASLMYFPTFFGRNEMMQVEMR